MFPHPETPKSFFRAEVLDRQIMPCQFKWHASSKGGSRNGQRRAIGIDAAVRS
jgi:hypothetical protein